MFFVVPIGDSLIKFRVLTFNVTCERLRPWARQNFPAPLKIERTPSHWTENKYLSWVYGVDRKIPSDRFFYPYHTPMIDTFSCIRFDLLHLIIKELAIE